MERCICIHGHFYQPPRENPWLEAIEIQDSAYPYHDWNERVTAECYAPNSASRINDAEGRIRDIVSNYARISFNFGPTLLSWMQVFSPDVYEAIREADRLSIKWRSGHGNAIAQVYNHIIMPLANTRDKRTQVLWGIKDFECRFGRQPEGMWLAETAVDIETLEMMAGQGIQFTILAPRQVSHARKIGSGKWKDVTRERIDPTRPYLCRLPSGRRITIFVYDGPISQAVAFEKLLGKGEHYANRLLSGFSFLRNWPQILNVATDGETYGHHHRFGEMALAYALHQIETAGPERLINYGEYLEKYPPTHEVQIIENTSWSCYHGVERWRSNCGCNSGGNPSWTQQWRGPLRNALDWLRDRLVFIFEQRAGEYLSDPWKARDEYIDVILDRSEPGVHSFLARNARRDLNENEKILVLKLMEMQRHAMLMYTSCGWFFDELSGIETVQVIQYAGRAVQLAEEVFPDDLESAFLAQLKGAKSNVPEYQNGARLYETWVKPSMINLKKVGVHYAISSLFEEYPDRTDIYCYSVERHAYYSFQAGQSRLTLGKIKVSSHITKESELISFCVFHLGGHAINGGVRTFQGEEAFELMKNETVRAFEGGDFVDIIRSMDAHFGMHNFSLKDLFRDEQRKILDIIIRTTLEEFEASYSQMYENSRILMGFLYETCNPIPNAFYKAAEFTLNLNLRKAFTEKIDIEKIRNLIQDIKKWNVRIDAVDLEFQVRHRIEEMFYELMKNPSDIPLLVDMDGVLGLLEMLPVEINFWEMQNVYHRMAKTVYREILAKADAGEQDAAQCVELFTRLGEKLRFNMPAVLGR